MKTMTKKTLNWNPLSAKNGTFHFQTPETDRMITNIHRECCHCYRKTDEHERVAEIKYKMSRYFSSNKKTIFSSVFFVDSALFLIKYRTRKICKPFHFTQRLKLFVDAGVVEDMNEQTAQYPLQPTEFAKAAWILGKTPEQSWGCIQGQTDQ